jgi:hypothetical protein
MAKKILFIDGKLAARYDNLINQTIPDDAIEVSDNLFFKTINETDGVWSLVDGDIVKLPLPKPTKKQVLDGYQSKIQVRLDTFAQERGYNNILSACTYATSNVPKFANEGQRCVDLRDQTWGEAYEIMSAVEAGGEVPTWDEVEAQLPELTWGD